MNHLARAGSFLFLGLTSLAYGQATIIDTPIEIPLETIRRGTEVEGYSYKFGIWASLGNSTTPALFEFDTGGDGFYAAWGHDSPWWGSYTPTSTPFSKSYGSGNLYTGNEATTTVSLYASGTPNATPKVTTGQVSVGQSSQIENGGQVLWTTNNTSANPPPVDGDFYGDFGLSLKASTNGISNLFTQLTYTTNVVAGFIVKGVKYGSTNAASVQIGISPTAATNYPIQFKMDGKSDSGGTYSNYSAELIKVAFSMSKDGSTHSQEMAINLDTGNPTPGLHNDGSIPDQFLNTNSSGFGQVVPGVNTQLYDTNGVSFFDFLTGTQYGSNYIYVEPKDKAYLNIGVPLFQQYEVMFDFENGVVGLAPLTVPESHQAGLMVFSLIGLWLAATARSLLRRRKRLAR